MMRFSDRKKSMSRVSDRLRAANADRRKDQETYGSVARALHWLVFALVATQIVIGWTMPHIRRGTPQEGLVGWHLSVGAVLMLIVVLRLVWRMHHPTPLTTSLTPWEHTLAKLTHGLLYVLLLVIPALGWAAAGYFGYTVRLFGFIPLPALTDNTMEWAHDAGDVHAILTNVLLVLVGFHVMAAFWHYFVRRDRVLQRMLPGIDDP
jgi:cytochrome b561